MKLLALDASTKRFSLALLADNKIVKSREVVLDKVLSSSIIPAIDKILKDTKTRLAQLDGFVIGLGPGSFTSLRVGLSTVKGLCFGLDKPVVGIASMDVIAEGVMDQLPKDIEQICVVGDARRQLVFGAIYEKKRQGLKRKSPYLLTDLNDLLGRINENTLFVGDGLTIYGAEIKDHFKAKIRVAMASEKDYFPDAKVLAFLGEKRFQEKKIDDIDRLNPLYLYPEDCQVTSLPPKSNQAAKSS